MKFPGRFHCYLQLDFFDQVSKHYQESDILDSPTVYYRSGLGDKISDYEDVWTNSDHAPKPFNKPMPSPDLLQHTQNVISLNNNVLSPTDSQRSHCSTPAEPQEVQKQGSPFYAEPADSLSQQSAVPKRLLVRNLVPVTQRHSNPPGLLSPAGLERIESTEFNGE